jgi:hypothetical protein
MRVIFQNLHKFMHRNKDEKYENANNGFNLLFFVQFELSFMLNLFRKSLILKK